MHADCYWRHIGSKRHPISDFLVRVYDEALSPDAPPILVGGSSIVSICGATDQQKGDRSPLRSGRDPEILRPVRGMHINDDTTRLGWSEKMASRDINVRQWKLIESGGKGSDEFTSEAANESWAVEGS